MFLILACCCLCAIYWNHVLRADQGSTLSLLAGCPKSHFLGWYRNFLVYLYLKLDNQVVSSTCLKDKLGWIWLVPYIRDLTVYVALALNKLSAEIFIWKWWTKGNSPQFLLCIKCLCFVDYYDCVLSINMIIWFWRHLYIDPRCTNTCHQELLS